MKVLVKGYSGTTTVNVTPDTTVKELKKKIQNKTGYNVNTGAMLISGKKYQGNTHNAKTLKNLRVTQNTTIHTVSGSQNDMNGGRKTRRNRNRKNMTRRRR